MIKQKKQTLMLLVVLALIVTALSLFSLTSCNKSNSLEYSLNNDGTYGVSGFSGSDSTTRIVIPSSYEGTPVTSISSAAFKGLNNLKEIIIPDSIIHIGYEALHNTAWFNEQPDGLVYAGKVAYSYKGTMPENSSITIEDGTKGIASRAFDHCTGLKSITIPDSVTGISAAPFADCYNLEAVYISDITKWCEISFEDGADPLLLARLYLNENLVTDLIIPDGVTKIANNAFYRYAYLHSVTIPNSVADIGSWAFYGCTALRAVTIGEGVTNIGSFVFKNCNLTSINWNAIACNNVDNTDTNNPIFYTSNYATVNIGENVTVIPAYAFSGAGITNITIPNSVTKIETYAFANCNNLANITFADSVEYIGKMAFSGTAWYNYQSDGLVYAGKVAYAYKGTMPNKTSITLKGDTKGITAAAFSGCTGLISVIIPDSVTNIGEGSFYGCSELTTVDWNATDCEIVGSATNYIFNGCTKLSTVNIGSNVIALPACVFSGNNVIESINVDESNTTFASQDGILYNKPKTSIIFVSKMISGTINIPASVTSIEDKVFSDCTYLERIDVDANNANFASQDGILYNKSKTSIICVPRKINGIITIPDGITSIGYQEFYGRSITSITIPKSVKSIGAHAFGAYFQLNINYNGTKAQWKSINKDSRWAHNLIVTTGASYIIIHCKNGNLDKDDNDC